MVTTLCKKWWQIHSNTKFGYQNYKQYQNTFPDFVDLQFSLAGNFSQFLNIILPLKYYQFETSLLTYFKIKLNFEKKWHKLKLQERDFDLHVEYCQNEPAAQEFIEEDDEAKEYFAVSTKPTKFNSVCTLAGHEIVSISEKRRWLARGHDRLPHPSN